MCDRMDGNDEIGFILFEEPMQSGLQKSSPPHIALDGGDTLSQKPATQFLVNLASRIWASSRGVVSWPWPK